MSETEAAFAVNRPGPEAVKLANAIYNTYMKVQEPMMVLSIERLCGLFGYEPSEETLAYIDSIFDELNEPAAVSNYEYEGEFYTWKPLEFCIYSRVRNAVGECYMVMINLMYVEAMRELVEDPFIIFETKER